MNVYLIAAVARNGCIGKDGKIPWYIPEDLKTFRLLTQGSVVIMGRKTWESIGKPLPNRVNIVVSTQDTVPVEGVLFVKSIHDAVLSAHEFGMTKNIFVIGGNAIYKAFMDIADGMYINHVALDVVDGDAFFPIINPLLWARHPFADGLVSPTTPSRWIYYSRTKKE